MTRRPRICLFTGFHPEKGGGGATDLRSAVSEFNRVEVRWLFLGTAHAAFPNSTRIGEPMFGGGLVADMLAAPFLWAGWRSPKLKAIASRLAAEEAEAFWFVAMNEGILVGNEIARQSNLPFHVSVQDDQAEAICRRSRRYRLLEPLALRAWRQLLERAKSVDVISEEMHDYYENHRRVRSFVFHPYVAHLPATPARPDPSALHIGHLGTLYSEPELLAFFRGASLAASRRDKPLRLTFIGTNRIDPRRHRALLPPGAIIELVPDLPEPEAVQKLSGCHFLYAMYPFGERDRVFRTTSLPTKLGSYVQMQRPVLAHTPEDSTLAAYVRRNGIGRVCASLDAGAIATAIEGILGLVPAREAFERTREREHGRHLVTQLEDALLALATRR